LANTDRPKLKIDKSCVGEIICCIATPINEERKDIPTISLAATAKQPVSTGPGNCPYHKRHESEIFVLKETVRSFYIDKSFNGSELSEHLRPFIKSNQIRICSYNILSDALAETDFSKDGLFPYCPDEFVSWSYREHLILDEIKGYQASIIALQELDTKLYKGKNDYKYENDYKYLLRKLWKSISR